MPENPPQTPPDGAAAVPAPSNRTRFRDSPYLPAVVIVLLVSCAAALFVASYSYATANPKPERIPVAVVNALPQQQEAPVLAKLDAALDSSLEVRRASEADATRMLDEQEVFAVIDVAAATKQVDVSLSSASGQAVATLLQQALPEVVESDGYRLTLRDAHPLQKGDPHGLTVFYMSIAAVILGFVGAIQLGVHASKLRTAERIAFTAAYALLGGIAITVTIDTLLGSLELPFLESWLVLSLAMFTSGMTFTMFSVLFGRWAILPTWAVMVLLGNPSSGGSVAWPLLPRVLAAVGGFLPPGATVNALHTAIYFPQQQHLQPFLVLAAWSAVGTAVYLWKRRGAATMR